MQKLFKGEALFMMIFITGGSASGKSRTAEKLCRSEKLYYIATMKVWDDECRKRIEKHRFQRRNKGFITIEMPDNIEKCRDFITDKKSTALVECIGNLLANEQFDIMSENPAEKIISGISELYKSVENLIIVSDEVFSDGNIYSPEMNEYIKNMGRINSALAEKSDIAIEVFCGIPVVMKGREIYNEIAD